MAENKKRRRGIAVILAGIGLLALLLVAAAFAGYHTGMAWFDNMFSHNAAASGGAGLSSTASTGGSGAAGNGCFVGIVCLDANGSGNANGSSQTFAASANDSGVGAGQ